LINIHLYPSPFLNESRILREACSLSRLALFDRIDLVGVGREGLPALEDLQDNIRIVRIGQRSGDRLIGKLRRTGDWTRAVYQRYRDDKLGCINCHSIATLPLGVLLKRATGARLVYDAHELETETNGLGGVRKCLTRWAERALIRHADHCIFVGQAIEQWYVRKYALRNVTVLYNCPPRRSVNPADYFRKAYSIDAGMPIFLYQGFIGEGRGIRNLVEAFAGLAGRAALVVMGYGPLADWIAGEAARHGGIHYHPAVAPERLLDYTAAADFGLSVIEATSLSYEYCMPNKLFEYVMARKPVLVSPTREQSEFVRRHGIGEVTSDASAAAIRDGVLRLLTRDQRVLQDALVRTADEYCWEGQEAKLEIVYLNALGMRSRRYGQGRQGEVRHDLCH
jgi:glycosyltransferase involved in cell wall biosynthesis